MFRQVPRDELFRRCCQRGPQAGECGLVQEGKRFPERHLVRMALQRKEHRRPQPQMVPQVAGQGTQDGKGMEHQGTCREPLGLRIADMDGEGLEEAARLDGP